MITPPPFTATWDVMKGGGEGGAMLVTPIFPHSINCSFPTGASGTLPSRVVRGPAICGAVHIGGMCIGSPSAPGRGRGGAHSAGEYHSIAYVAVG